MLLIFITLVAITFYLIKYISIQTVDQFSGRILTYHEDKGIRARTIDEKKRQNNNRKWGWGEDNKLYNLDDIRAFGSHPFSGRYLPCVGFPVSTFEPREVFREQQDFAEGWYKSLR